MFQPSLAGSSNRETLSFRILGEFKGLETQLSVSCLHSTDSEQATPGTSKQSQGVSIFELADQHKEPVALPLGSEIQMDIDTFVDKSKDQTDLGVVQKGAEKHAEEEVLNVAPSTSHKKGDAGEPMEVEEAPVQVHDIPAEGPVAPTTHVALDVGLRGPNAPDPQMGAGPIDENVFLIPERPRRRCSTNV